MPLSLRIFSWSNVLMISTSFLKSSRASLDTPSFSIFTATSSVWSSSHSISPAMKNANPNLSLLVWYWSIYSTVHLLALWQICFWQESNFPTFFFWICCILLKMSCLEINVRIFDITLQKLIPAHKILNLLFKSFPTISSEFLVFCPSLLWEIGIF